MWQGGDIPLEHVGANSVEREELEGKRKRKIRGEISSTLSLEFSVIGPSVSIGARRKVLLRDESFVWV